MQATKAQIEAIDALIRGEKKVNKRTLEALIKKGLYADGKVTQEGLKVTTVKAVEVDVIRFGADVTYNNPTPSGKYETIVFPVGTEMIATFPIVGKHQTYYEGIILIKGKSLWVRIARSPRFEYTKRLMPVKE